MENDLYWKKYQVQKTPTLYIKKLSNHITLLRAHQRVQPLSTMEFSDADAKNLVLNIGYCKLANERLEQAEVVRSYGSKTYNN